MKVKRLSECESVEFAPVTVVFEDEDADAEFMAEAMERLSLLRREGWRLEFLARWFALQVSQRELSIDTDAELKVWVSDRFSLFCAGDRELKKRIFLRVLCLQERFPVVSDRELMLSAVIVFDALDYYQKEGHW